MAQAPPFDPIAEYLAKRDSLIQHPPADCGRALSETLSDHLDDAIRAISPNPELTLVAMGSYGRRELCFFSDIDLMILHNGDAGKEAVEKIFYPLWNSGLKVGHSLRTVGDAMELARTSFETLSSLATARLVAGDSRRLTELSEALARYVAKNPVGAELVAEERARRNSEPWPRLTLDLKTGRAGLRTAAAIEWDRRTRDQSGSQRLREAVDQLLATRNALHARSGRALDSPVLDIRTPAASWLAVTPKELLDRTQRAHRVIEREARAQWPELAGGFGKTRLRDRFRRPAPRPLTTIEAAASAATEGRFLDEHELERAHFETGHWSAEQRTHLLTFLAHPQHAWQVFDQLVEIGWVERSLRTFTHVAALGQLAPFHEHPVDVHLWRTVAEMSEIIRSDGADSLAHELASELDPRTLRLIAWLHDIGKGMGGDHSRRGARVAEKLGSRLGLDERESRLLVRAIELHLVLANTALRRDTSDPDVIKAVADRIGEVELLRILYVLTVADSLATGTGNWNEWRAGQIRALYRRVDAYLAGESQAADATRYEQWFTAEERWAHDELRTIGPGEVRMLLDGSPPFYLITVAAHDRTGLLSAVTGVLALHNMSIQGARLTTDGTGLVIDTFRVSSALRTDEITEAIVGRARTDLLAVLNGELNVEAALLEKAKRYGREPDPNVRTRISVDEGHSTVIEIKTADRFGLLHDLCHAISDTGLDIHLAKIDTRKTEAVDVFYCTELDGSPVTPDHIVELTQRLADIV